MTPDVDAFLYASNHDWARERAIRKEIAREVYLAGHGHPVHNTIARLLGALGVIALAVLWVSWPSGEDRF